MLQAAVGLVEQADLADLLSFLGTRAVADAADVRPATVHHHFANPDKTAKPNERLAAAVLETVLDDNITSQAAEPLASATDKPALDPSDLRFMGQVASDNLRQRLDDRTQAVVTFLAAAAAANDPAAKAAARRDYERIRDSLVGVFDTLIVLLGRRYEPGWSSEQVALFGNALSDGLVLHHQYDPEGVDPDRYGELCWRLWETVTSPADGDAPVDPVTERLLGHVDPLGLPDDSGLDQTKRARIIDAVRALYDDGGAGALSVSAAAREAGVSRGTVLANFGDRNGLAVAVWARHVPELELRLEADRQRRIPLARLLERHLVRLVDRCAEDRELSGMVMEGIVSRTVRRGLKVYDDPSDPRTAVPFALMLVPVLLESTDELWPGLADTRESAYDLAAMITHSCMVRSMARPDAPTGEAVSAVMDVLLDGMLRRPTR